MYNRTIYKVELKNNLALFFILYYRKILLASNNINTLQEMLYKFCTHKKRRGILNILINANVINVYFSYGKILELREKCIFVLTSLEWRSIIIRRKIKR